MPILLIIYIFKVTLKSLTQGTKVKIYYNALKKETQKIVWIKKISPSQYIDIATFFLLFIIVTLFSFLFL